jgi:hypothetical protein
MQFYFTKRGLQKKHKKMVTNEVRLENVDVITTKGRENGKKKKGRV